MKESSRLKFLPVLMATVINPRCQEAAEAHMKASRSETKNPNICSQFVEFCHVIDVVGI